MIAKRRNKESKTFLDILLSLYNIEFNVILPYFKMIKNVLYFKENFILVNLS